MPSLQAVCSYLIEKGADVNATDNFGNNALFWAVKNGHDDVVQILLLHKARCARPALPSMTSLPILSISNPAWVHDLKP